MYPQLAELQAVLCTLQSRSSTTAMHSSQSFRSHSVRQRRFPWRYIALLVAGLVMFSSVWPTRAAGPAALVKDINTASTRKNSPSIPSPAFITSAGSRVYFLGYDLNNGYELWSSDGTPTGTRIVRDIAPGNQDTLSVDMVDVAGTLYFSADTPACGRPMARRPAQSG